ncbi:MAG: hypothetical protein WDM89_19485 [Rhizomicrobium sp.]
MVAAKVGAVISDPGISNSGPFVFLHDDDIFDDAYIHAFATALPAANSAWQVFRPTSRTTAAMSNSIVDSKSSNAVVPIARSTIFISHGHTAG